MNTQSNLPPIWVVYHRPRDFPNVLFMSRVWYGEVPTDQVMFADSLAEMHRKLIAHGASVSIGRMPGDDPCIVECWL